MPLLVLTGFLGSGKTTFLRGLLAQPDMRDTVVLVNEFGEIGLDHLLVERLADDVVLLESGCVCCAVGDQLETVIVDLFARASSGALPPFRRLVLETTGLADPSLVLQRVLSSDELVSYLRIQLVLTVVDAVYGLTNMQQYPESSAQVAIADRILLSKTDLADSSTVTRCLEHVRTLNPTAPVLRAGCTPTAQELFRTNTRDEELPRLLQNADAKPAPHEATDQRHTARFSTFVLRRQAPVAWDDFRAWLEGLLIARGSSILRLKGLVRVEGCDRPWLIQGVQQSMYLPVELEEWPQGRAETQLVFITRDLSKEATLRSLQQVLGDLPDHRTAQANSSVSLSMGCFEVEGFVHLPAAVSDCHRSFLIAQRSHLHAHPAGLRPWHFTELHNPWSRAATLVDSWGFLDVCHSESLLAPLRKVVGPDIVLYDSQWLPDPTLARFESDRTESDAHRFPVNPVAGTTVLIAVSAVTVTVCLRSDQLGKLTDCLKTLELSSGDALLCDARLPYRVDSCYDGDVPSTYAIRYFPATSLYERDSGHASHRMLMERYPLLNYATLPLWLAHGVDRAGNDFVTGFDVRAGRWVPARM